MPKGTDQGAASEAPGPANSPPSAGRLLIADIALRGGALLARKLVGKRLAKMDYSPREAADIIGGRGIAKATAAAVATRLGVRSLPRAALVGGIVLAKTLYDRKRARAAKARSGQAKPGGNGPDEPADS